jgi:hypothetical protein
MRSFNALKKRWDDEVSCRHYHPGIVIKDAGLVLGADTILVRMDETPPAPRLSRSRPIGNGFWLYSVFPMGIAFRAISSKVSKRHRNSGSAATRF